MQRLALPDRVFDSMSGRMLDDHAVVIAGDGAEGVVPASQIEDPLRFAGPRSMSAMASSPSTSRTSAFG